MPSDFTHTDLPRDDLKTLPTEYWGTLGPREIPRRSAVERSDWLKKWGDRRIQ